MSIVQKEDSVLRKRAAAVLQTEFGSKDLKSLIEKMAKALDKEEDEYSVGVALAAPQIGVSKRLFIVRTDRVDRKTRHEKLPPKITAYINPRIVKTSRSVERVDEGCLSVKYEYGYVDRHERVTIEAKNEEGHLIKQEATGLLSQVFQHEIDHLDGVLFIDRAAETWRHGPDDE
jgi:peptide deformylase